MIDATNGTAVVTHVARKDAFNGPLPPCRLAGGSAVVVCRRTGGGGSRVCALFSMLCVGAPPGRPDGPVRSFAAGAPRDAGVMLAYLSTPTKIYKT